MIKKRLINPKVKKQKKSFSNLSDITQTALNCTLTHKIENAQKYQLVCDFSCDIVKLYNVNGNVYAYNNNGELWEFDKQSGTINMIESGLTEPPLVVGVSVDGQKAPLIITPNGGKVNSVNMFMPFGDFATTFRGSSFTAKDHAVYFSEAYDFNTYSFNEFYGTLLTEERDGVIVGLEKIGSTLFVFCQHAIYKVNFDQTLLFSLEKQKVSVGNIEHSSVKSVGAKAFFISQGKLYSFDGNSIALLNAPLTDGQLTFLGGASACEDKYLALVSVQGCLAQYVYSDQTKKYEISLIPTDIVCDGGLFADSLGSVYALFCGEGQVYGDLTWKSERLNFNSHLDKALTKITFNSSGLKTFCVAGEFGLIEYNTVDGINCFTLNSQSKWFEFSVCGQMSFSFDNLSVEYRIIGE